MASRISAWHLRLVLVVALLAAPGSAMAQDTVSPIFVDARGFDPVGDSPDAPDIGKVQHTVLPNGAFRRVAIGVWLNRSDLAEGERVAVYFNWAAGGELYFGGDGLFVLHGHTPSADAYATYLWDGGQWVTAAFRNPGVETFGDGRLYFRVDFDPAGSTPEAPRWVELRVSSLPGPAGGLIDYAPDAGQTNIRFSLEPHGLPDPLEGCSYDGGCVGPASGPSKFGPAPNSGGGGGPAEGASGGKSAECKRARRKVRAAGRRLSRARVALRHADRGAETRRLRSKVRRFERRHAALKRSAAAKC